MRRTPLTVVGASFALALTLAACGGDDSGDATPETTAAGGSGGGSEVVVIGKNNLKFDKSEYEAEAGSVNFVYENEGSIAHTLLVRGESGFKLSIGTTDEGSLDLEPGTYELYCDVAGHEAAGMVAELTVT